MEQIYQNHPLSQEKKAKKLVAWAQSQKRSRKKRKITLKPYYTSPIVQRCLPEILKIAPKSYITVLNEVHSIKVRNKFPYVSVSQANIARRCGLSRATVNRALGFWDALGVIKSKYNHMKTCVVILSSVFYQKKHRETLKQFFVSFLLVVSIATCYTRKILSSSLSFSCNNKLSSREESYAHAREKTPKGKNVGNSLKHAIIKLPITPVVRPDGLNRLEYLGIVARNKYMEKKFKDLHLAIDNITEIDLSLFGKCKLSIFTPEAIQSARWKMREIITRKKKILDPFEVFFSLCEADSLTRGERRDYETFRRLSQKYNFHTDDDPLNSTKMSAKVPTIKTKQPNEYKPLPKEQPKSLDELQADYDTVMNNQQLQDAWRLFPAIKEAWTAAHVAKVAEARKKQVNTHD